MLVLVSKPTEDVQTAAEWIEEEDNLITAHLALNAVDPNVANEIASNYGKSYGSLGYCSKLCEDTIAVVWEEDASKSGITDKLLSNEAFVALAYFIWLQLYFYDLQN